MFPRLFSRVNRMGAPVTGMIVLGVVQSLLALMTISPSLSEQLPCPGQPCGRHQRATLHHRAIRTDGDDEAAGVPERKYRLNVAIATVGMLYSVFAIYASGKDAVLGGMIVTAIGFMI